MRRGTERDRPGPLHRRRLAAPRQGCRPLGTAREAPVEPARVVPGRARETPEFRSSGFGKASAGRWSAAAARSDRRSVRSAVGFAIGLPLRSPRTGVSARR